MFLVFTPSGEPLYGFFHEQPSLVLPTSHCRGLLCLTGVNPYHGLGTIILCTASQQQRQRISLVVKHRLSVKRFANYFTLSRDCLFLAFINLASGLRAGRPASATDLVVVNLRSGAWREMPVEGRVSSLQWAANGRSLALHREADIGRPFTVVRFLS